MSCAQAAAEVLDNDAASQPDRLRVLRRRREVGRQAVLSRRELERWLVSGR